MKSIFFSFLTRGCVALTLVGAGAPLRALDQTAQKSILTLGHAIELAIKNNVTVRLAQADSEDARGQALRSAAALLPHVMGSLQESRTFKVNLAAEGFPANSPVIPSLIGPFNTFDARLQLVQSLLDVGAIRRAQAERRGEKIAAEQERLAREQVAAATGLAYFDAQRALRAVNAAQADVELAQSLFKLAQDQHINGIATGVDVARAKTRAAQQNLKLIQSQIAAQQADIQLKREVGLPLNDPIQLDDLTRTSTPTLPTIDQTLAAADSQRAELKIADETLTSADEMLSAARDQHLPTITGRADYGLSGTSPSDAKRTGSIGARLDLPIFSGGDLHGQTLQAQAQQREAKARRDDMRAQVEEDVRLSLQILTAELEETKTADQAAQLAQRELKMARDRYTAGVGDNIQLLSAQDALDRAIDDQVNAYARTDTARINLATATGQAESFRD